LECGGPRRFGFFSAAGEEENEAKPTKAAGTAALQSTPAENQGRALVGNSLCNTLLFVV
jgi:hypothetical protein